MTSSAAAGHDRAERAWAACWGLAWGLLVLTVQPLTASGSSAPKVLLLGLALALAVVVFRSSAPMRLPVPVWALLLQAAILVPATLTMPGAGGVLVKWVRLLASLLVVAVLCGRMRRADHRLALWHLAVHALLGLVVAAGAVLLPHSAFIAPDGDAEGAKRLVGVFLPLAAPRVGEVGAMCVGLSLLLALFGLMRHRWAGLLVALGAGLMVLSGTRTAMASTVVSLGVAFVLTRHTRPGWRGLRAMALLAVPAVVALPWLLRFLQRGQDLALLFSLTGRTYTWQHILSLDLPPAQLWFGHGLGEFELLMHRSDNTYAPMPIDNGFIAQYWMCGLVGVILVGAFLLAVWAEVLLAAPGPNRALAGFLATFVSIACITESGLGDLSAHTLHLLAATYLAASSRWVDAPSPSLLTGRGA